MCGRVSGGSGSREAGTLNEGVSECGGEWLAKSKVERVVGKRVREGACIGSSSDVAGGRRSGMCARVGWERVVVCADGARLVVAVIALARLRGSGGGDVGGGMGCALASCGVLAS